MGNIISLSEGVHHPPPVVSSRIPAQRAPWWDGPEAALSQLAEGMGQPRLCWFPLQWSCWSEPLAESELHGPWGAWFLQPAMIPKQAKIPHLYTGKRPEQQLWCWENLCSSEMRNQMGLQSIPQGQECRWQRRHLQVQPWLSMLRWSCLGPLRELCGNGTESFAPGKTHDRLYIPGICDPFSLHCPEVCHWETILQSEIPYLED